jgi:hypothetical protein
VLISLEQQKMNGCQEQVRHWLRLRCRGDRQQLSVASNADRQPAVQWRCRYALALAEALEVL